MDRSVRRLPDSRLPNQVAKASSNERRRCVRQKLHTPVYASFNGMHTNQVVDLSELLDLHEDGFAVQTSERLEMNRAVTVSLDLPETRSFIHGSGEVVWSDEDGHGGVRFSSLAGTSRKILKEWLFANLLIACSNHAARTEQLAEHERAAESLAMQPPPVDVLVDAPDVSASADPRSSGTDPIFGGSATPFLLEAVRCEVRELGGDLDSILHLVNECAMSLTGATGAALAFVTDGRMVWRACAGAPTPPLGTPVDVSQGLSGECARSGFLVSCDDMEHDLRIDPEIGRALGIGSLMAAPIVSNFRVVGLLEVFAPHPRGFAKTHERVVERLVEMVESAAHFEHARRARPSRSMSPHNSVRDASHGSVVVPPTSKALSEDVASAHSVRAAGFERESDVPPETSGQTEEPVLSEQVLEQVGRPPFRPPSRLLHLGLLGLVTAVVAMVAGYLAAPLIERRWVPSPQASQNSAAAVLEVASRVSPQGMDGHVAQSLQPKSLPELRRLAQQGNAEAQWRMGVRYHDGEDVPHDDAEAARWFQRAAEQGNVDAQGALGAFYWQGRGVPQDLSKAYFWSEIAMAQGDEISKGRVEGLASQMTRDQVSSARQKAEDWIQSHIRSSKSAAD
jgi:GAF domain-containing protein